MAKFVSLKTKLAICKEYNEGNISQAALARKYGVARYSVMIWLKRYALHGERGLHTKSAHQKYPPAFKKQVVEDHVKNNISYVDLAAIYLLPTATVKNWVRTWYNETNHEKDPTRREDESMSSRKTTAEERIDIARWMLEHDNDSETAAKLFQVPEHSAMHWAEVYEKEGADGLQWHHKTKSQQPAAPSEERPTDIQRELEQRDQTIHRLEETVRRLEETIRRQQRDKDVLEAELNVTKKKWERKKQRILRSIDQQLKVSRDKK